MKTAADVRFLLVGVGMANTFRCGACTKPRPIFGRRMRRVLGLRQYVCKGCAK